MSDSLDDVKKKIKEMNAFIADLEPAVRAAAFEMLRPYYFGSDGNSKNGDREPATRLESMKPVTKTAASKTKPLIAADTAEEFFGQFETNKPHENVMLIAAWLYSQFGIADIDPAELKEIANAAGLTVSPRADNTLRQAKKNGKALFRQMANGWQPTLAGEAYLKETFGIKKGTKQKPERGQ